MAYPNERVFRYKEDGKKWDGTFVEKSREEISVRDEVAEILETNGIDPSVAASAAEILEANDLI
jgi:hypothetical protein